MILTPVLWRTGFLQVLSVFFRRIGVIEQQFLAFREFQKSSKKKKQEKELMCDNEEKIQEDNE